MSVPRSVTLRGFSCFRGLSAALIFSILAVHWERRRSGVHFIRAKSILSPQNGMNLYRGCTHGCIYCDSRSTCYQMDHAFEDVAISLAAEQPVVPRPPRFRGFIQSVADLPDWVSP